MDKRGLSAVVTTLIIILLVLVAVGIVWVVVRNVIETGTGQLDINAKCLAVNMEAVSVVNTTEVGNYNITLHRDAGGDDIGGVKLVLKSPTENGDVMDFASIIELDTETQSYTPAQTGLTDGFANVLEYTVYFLDDSGNEVACSPTQELSL
jgi:hypothetical protein